jgi:ketosteroid isomerase-like protein
MHARCTPVLYALIAVAVAAQTLPVALQAQTPEELMERFATAWTEKDHAAIEAMLAEDAIYFDASEMHEGRTAVAVSWRASMDATEEMIITPLRTGTEGSTAYHVGRWQLTGDGRVVMEGVHSFVFRREENGTWKIASAHVEDSAPASAVALEGPIGAITVSLPESALPPEQVRNAGEWWIQYGENGTHVVHHGEHEVLTGTHEIRGDRIIHREQTGPYACDVPGTYTWNVRDGKLHFTAVEDACAERVAVLTSRPWSPAPRSARQGGS